MAYSRNKLVKINSKRKDLNYNMSNFAGQNINRVNAIKQLGKGIKNENETELLGSFVNAFIYYVDTIKESNDLKKKEIELDLNAEVA